MTSQIRFVFNRTKAIQVLWQVIKQAKLGLLPSDIMGLLYLIDREVLVHRGHSVTTDELLLTPEGFSLKNMEVILNGTLYSVNECDELSKYEETVIFCNVKKYSTSEQLHEALKALPEYKTVTETVTIDPADIMRLENVPEEDIREAASYCEELAFFDNLLLNGKSDDHQIHNCNS